MNIYIQTIMRYIDNFR